MRFHEPLFHTPDEAETYVNRELGLAVPKGWRICRLPDEHLTWVVQKETPASDEWPVQEYSVRVDGNLDSIIFTYGNNDVGPFSLHHALRTALVIKTAMLRRFELSECLRDLFAHHKPNEWGYT